VPQTLARSMKQGTLAFLRRPSYCCLSRSTSATPFGPWQRWASIQVNKQSSPPSNCAGFGEWAHVGGPKAKFRLGPIVYSVYTVAVCSQSTHLICSNVAVAEQTTGSNTPPMTQPTSGAQCSIHLALHSSGPGWHSQATPSSLMSRRPQRLVSALAACSDGWASRARRFNHEALS